MFRSPTQEPNILLLDKPLGALDAKVRKEHRKKSNLARQPRLYLIFLA